MHKDTAIDAYVRQTGNLVEKNDLHLFECGFLGSSPDGLVITSSGEKGVLEVKCPYEYREKL